MGIPTRNEAAGRVELGSGGGMIVATIARKYAVTIKGQLQDTQLNRNPSQRSIES